MSNYSQDELNDIEEIKNLLNLPFAQERMLYRLHYINHSENSKKFYELWIKPTENGLLSMVAVWGRIGASGQTKVYTKGSESHCRRQAESLFYEKKKKGYKVIAQA